MLLPKYIVDVDGLYPTVTTEWVAPSSGIESLPHCHLVAFVAGLPRVVRSRLAALRTKGSAALECGASTVQQCPVLLTGGNNVPGVLDRRKHCARCY